MSKHILKSINYTALLGIKAEIGFSFLLSHFKPARQFSHLGDHSAMVLLPSCYSLIWPTTDLFDRLPVIQSIFAIISWWPRHPVSYDRIKPISQWRRCILHATNSFTRVFLFGNCGSNRKDSTLYSLYCTT